MEILLYPTHARNLNLIPPAATSSELEPSSPGLEDYDATQMAGQGRDACAADGQVESRTSRKLQGVEQGQRHLFKKKHKGNDASPFIDQRATARIRVAGWGRARAEKAGLSASRRAKRRRRRKGTQRVTPMYMDTKPLVSLLMYARLSGRGLTAKLFSLSREERGKEKKKLKLV